MIRRYINYLFIIGLLAIPFSSIAQDQKNEQKEKKVKINDGTREELHRYMGYENLLVKYISLPYDVIMNTNVQGTFIDISYLLLLILPIIFLFKTEVLWIRLLWMLLMLLFYCISTLYGFCAARTIEISELDQMLSKQTELASVSGDFFAILKLNLLKGLAIIFQPLMQLLEGISGKGDSITYPILILFFLSLVYLIKRGLHHLSKDKMILLIFYSVYGFFWWLLSVGVVWYGILLLPIGLLMTILGLNLNAKLTSNFSTVKVIKYLISTSIGLWLLISYTSRLSNYNPVDTLNAKGAINGASLLYGLGKADEQKVMDLLYPNFNPVIKKINRDKQAQVYRAGTFFHYFISNNDTRVLADNQLSIFNGLTKRFPEKSALAEAFKRSGYKYLLIDLNVASIDNTPDQSLKSKSKQLFTFLSNNPHIRLIGTDRIMRDANGNPSYSLKGTSIRDKGTFAAFEII